MATVHDIVTRALRLLRVIDAHSPPEAQVMADSIGALNAMMQRWEANGLALGWQAVENPAELVPAPPEAHEAIAYNLAVRMRPEFGANLEPDVVGVASEGLASLQRDRLVEMPLTLKARTPGNGRYNIYTDDFN